MRGLISKKQKWRGVELTQWVGDCHIRVWVPKTHVKTGQVLGLPLVPTLQKQGGGLLRARWVARLFRIGESWVR